MSIERSIDQVVEAANFLKKQESITFIERVSALLARRFAASGKVLIAGNGGSLCDAMHFAEELTGQFRSYRPALPAMAIADPSHMSCVANDMGFDQVFSRHIEAFGQSGDVLILLTTSGNSSNILHAYHAAKKKGMATVAFLGKSGGALRGLCDLEWVIEGFAYSDRIQEAHMAALHLIVEEVERQLFPSLVFEKNTQTV